MNKYQHKQFKCNKCDHPILNSIHLNIIEIWNILNSTFSLNVNNEKYGCSEIIQVIRIQYTKIVCASKSGVNHLLFMNIKSIYEISIQIRWNLNNSDAECFELCKKHGLSRCTLQITKVHKWTNRHDYSSHLTNSHTVSDHYHWGRHSVPHVRRMCAACHHTQAPLPRWFGMWS